MVKPKIFMMEKWEGVEIMVKFDVEVMELIEYVMGQPVKISFASNLSKVKPKDWRLVKTSWG